MDRELLQKKSGRWRSRICGAGLALLLAALLCACQSSAGQGSAEQGGTENGRPADSGGDAAGNTPRADAPVYANSALAKENVYRVSEIAIPELPGGSGVNVESLARCAGGICAVMKQYDWDNGHRYFILSVDEGGNAPQTAFLELPTDREPDAQDGGEEGQQDQDAWEQQDIRYSDFVTGAEGRTYALRQYRYSYANYRTEEFTEEERQTVCCWDMAGRLLWQVEPGLDSGEALSVWALFPAADGSLDVFLTGENAYRITVSEDGALLGADAERLSEATAKALGKCRRLLPREDGSCLLLCSEAEGGLSLTPYDLRTDTLGEAFDLPDDLPATALASTVFAAGRGSDLIYAGSRGVFTWNRGDAQGSIKMDYVNSDRNITDTKALVGLDETHFAMFYREDNAPELKAGIFSYVKPEDIPDRAVVVLGGLSVNGGIRKRVVQYNRESSQYRVVLKEYASAEDLNLDIISGRMPDILMAEGLPMRSYIAKGLIADVGMLLEGDGELSRAQFLENVFDAYSVDGKLRYIVPSFTLSTMAAKSSLVGDGSDWSMAKMLEVLAAMGPDARLLDGLDRDRFMETVLEYCGNDFIDLETGKCAFDSPEFVAILQFARTLPEEGSYAGEGGEGEYEQQYLKNRTLLLELSVWSFSQDVEERIFYQLNGYLGGEYTLVGFPRVSATAAENGNGALINGNNLMALSAVSENTQGAWDFARYYLTDEYQRSLESSLPVDRQIFGELAEEETRRPYYTDENGQTVEYDLYMPGDEEPVAVPPLSQEQLEELIAYLESATATPYADAFVLNIIREELGSYFSGQKTAEDVAAIIQNRVQMYVQENQ